MIFFDLDGTLLDHRSSEYLGVKSFYKEYGKCLKFEEDMFYKQWCYVSDKHFNKYLNGEITFRKQRIERIKELFNFSDIKLSDDTAENVFNNYLKIYENNWKAFSDVIPCLKQLYGYKLGIISNGDLEQ
jgi:putative hydrolase of the HAD superfamily